MAIQSGGRLLKNTLTTVWEGTPATWNGWPTRATGGSAAYWASYSSMYRDQLWVGTVVDKRAKGVARLPLKTYVKDDLNRPEAVGHPYTTLMRNPSPKVSAFFFWLWTVSTYDTFGESFSGKVRDRGGRPVGLVPLHPTCMHEEGFVDGRLMWTFQNGAVRVENIPDEDLFHPRTYNPDSFTRGLSALEKLRWTLENEEMSRRATSAFWRNGARPGVALTHPGKLSDASAERLKVQWAGLFAGADNVGKTVVLEEGMKPETLTLTAEEAQYIESRKLNREEVCAAYDVPPPVVHILDHATYSNITEQMRSMYRDTMAPVLRGLEAELETQVRSSVRPGASEPDFGGDVYAEFLMDEVLSGDFEQQADSFQKAINSGWMTPAEVRRARNLPFIEGSDRLYVNSTMVPLDAVGGGQGRELSLVEMIQKIYLGVGTVVTVAEARQILNDAGANLTGPPPAVNESSVRTVMGRLSRATNIDDVDAVGLVAGLPDGDAALIRAVCELAVANSDNVAGLRSRIKTLEVAK